MNHQCVPMDEKINVIPGFVFFFKRVRLAGQGSLFSLTTLLLCGHICSSVSRSGILVQETQGNSRESPVDCHKDDESSGVSH